MISKLEGGWSLKKYPYDNMGYGYTWVNLGSEFCIFTIYLASSVAFFLSQEEGEAAKTYLILFRGDVVHRR